jgi:hypothetical protein
VISTCFSCGRQIITMLIMIIVVIIRWSVIRCGCCVWVGVIELIEVLLSFLVDESNLMVNVVLWGS